jgi:DNA mismatch repair protein MutS2
MTVSDFESPRSLAREGFPEDSLDRLEFPRLIELLRGLATSFEGDRRLSELRPLRSREEAERELALVAALKSRTEAGEGLPSIEVGDLRSVFSRLRMTGSVLSAEEFLSLAPLLTAVRTARARLEAAREEFPDLAELGDPLMPLPQLERALAATFDPTSGEVKDSASPELRRLRRERETRRERLRARMERLAAKLAEHDAGSLVTLREDRYVLAVPQTAKAKMPGLVQDRSASGATFYVEPMEVVEDNNALKELDAEERAEVRRVLAELTHRFRVEEASLVAGYERTGELDALRARALLARRWAAEAPELTETPRLRLTGARHPLLFEARRQATDFDRARESVVPLALELDEGTRILLVTGPNMGGKTVALKGVGLMSAMAQAGCLIPADPGCVLPWAERWTVSLGDEQSLDMDLSTFAAHLARWGEALEAAGPRTLVLLDELGSGTDPAEGAALAQSVLERLAEAKSLGLVTTHLGVLKGFAAAAEGIRNASMAFDPETRRPTYTLAVGIPGESHALEMARRLGFPEERVARAEALLPTEERDVKRLLAELAEERRRLGEARAEVESLRREAARAEAEQKERLARLLEERSQVRAKAARQAREILRRAEETLRRVQVDARSGGRREAVNRRELAREQARLARLETPSRPKRGGRAPGTVREGERYWSEDLGREVEVARGADASGRVLVIQGNVKVELPAASLRTLEDRPPADAEAPPPPRRPVTGVPETESVPIEVDLRGLRVDEALERLDHALDRALLAGLKELRVIHGKGTGALREAVREFTRTHGGVASARVADQWEGGTGATVIELEG